MMESTVLDTLHVMHDFVIALLFPLFFFLYFLYVTVLYIYRNTCIYAHTLEINHFAFFALLSVARQVCNKEKKCYIYCMYLSAYTDLKIE